MSILKPYKRLNNEIQIAEDDFYNAKNQYLATKNQYILAPPKQKDAAKKLYLDADKQYLVALDKIFNVACESDDHSKAFEIPKSLNVPFKLKMEMFYSLISSMCSMSASTKTEGLEKELLETDIKIKELEEMKGELEKILAELNTGDFVLD
ncbi:5479_t:CDS:2, partial [Gigaspora margarita]